MIRAARGESPAGFDRRCIPAGCASRRLARPCPGYIQITWGCTLVALWLLMAPGGLVAQAGRAQSTQPMDADFATRVREWTTRPEFVSPLVDHLPVADGIPSPKDVLGHHAGAPRPRQYRERVPIMTATSVKHGARCSMIASPRDAVKTLRATQPLAGSASR